MTKRIEKLSLDGFRGASKSLDLHFDTSKPIALIFGENGTGKSSIIDALDFVCNRQFGSVQERSGTEPKKHIVALKCASKDLKVSLSFNKETWVATLDKMGPAVTGKGAAPKARILRRSQILKVINERPADRYKAVQGFIGVPGIEQSEESLRGCVATLKTDLNQAVAARTQAETALTEAWVAEGKKGSDFLSWAEQRAKEDPAKLQSSVTAANTLITSLKTAQTTVDAYVEAVKSAADAEGKAKKASDAVAAAQSESKSNDAALIELLKETEKFLKTAGAADTCPVCERPGITLEGLLKRIVERLSAMNSIVKLKETSAAATKVSEGTAAILVKARQKLVEEVRTLASGLKDSRAPEVTALKLDWSKFANMTAAAAPQATDPVVREAQALQLAAKTCQVSLTTAVDTNTKSLNQLSMIQRDVKTLEEKKVSSVDTEARLKRAEAILEAVSKERKAYVDKILDAISDEVARLCEVIHPGEGIKVRFFLNPKTKGSLESIGEFAGTKDVPPQAYYSESHLDTLGVCIFLAMSKHFREDNTIVILDDVVTSVDAPHMDRFIGLVLDEAQHFDHLIIATHYRPWLERFRHSKSPKSSVQLIHLAPWSLARGIRASSGKFAIEELKEAVEATSFDRQIVASKAGIYLESILDHLALIYECDVPRKAEPVYTLGELLNSLGKKLRAALTVEQTTTAGSTKIPLGPTIDALDSLTWIRNQVGCHWNLAGFDVPDKDVETFGKKTLELASALICAGCGEVPSRNKDGTHWQCRCAKHLLSPLERPS